MLYFCAMFCTEVAVSALLSKHVVTNPLSLAFLSALSLLTSTKPIWNKLHVAHCPFFSSPKTLTSCRNLSFFPVLLSIFTKIGKYTGWTPGFVSQALPEYVGVRRQNGTRGAILKIAYEDIRLAPHSSLLQELDALEHNSSKAPDSNQASDPNEAPNTSSLLAS